EVLTSGAPIDDALPAGAPLAAAPVEAAPPITASPPVTGAQDPDDAVRHGAVPEDEGPANDVLDSEVLDSEVLDSAMSDVHVGDEEAVAEAAPEVELSETEVAEVLSGRVIPIGAFFNGAQSPPAGEADADTAGVAGAAFLTDAGRIASAWAQDRYLGLTSACGICLALAACAATWFSAGTRTDIVRGVAALWGGYLVLRAGQWLVRQTGQIEIARSSADTMNAESPAQGPVIHGARNTARRRQVGPAAWLVALGGALAECGVYAGLAVGAAAERWGAVWTLAVAVVSLVGVRNLMTACSTPPGFGEQPQGAFRRVAAAVLTMPVGGRVLLVGIVAPFWGARVALLALLDWAIVSIGYGIAGRAAAGVTARARRLGEPGQGPVRSELVRLRDDGALARALGVLVRGNLMPLPPAILGLAAISTLALLGLHGLPGALLIAPAIVMLLAAPGSAHPHSGRFDWLVPVLLLGAQFLYLTAVGLAARVPGPVIFALAAAILLRYTDLAWPGRPVQLARPRDPEAEPAERGTGLGWEGRLLFAGLTAAMGVATFAYLALTAYLLALIFAKAVTSCLEPSAQAAGDRLDSDGGRTPPSAS
ncbi:MAG TPA: hypothetical protein VGH96_03915, partial [Streptosporangiaceae bacterium]